MRVTVKPKVVNDAQPSLALIFEGEWPSDRATMPDVVEIEVVHMCGDGFIDWDWPYPSDDETDGVLIPIADDETDGVLIPIADDETDGVWSCSAHGLSGSWSKSQLRELAAKAIQDTWRWRWDGAIDQPPVKKFEFMLAVN